MQFRGASSQAKIALTRNLRAQTRLGLLKRARLFSLKTALLSSGRKTPGKSEVLELLCLLKIALFWFLLETCFPYKVCMSSPLLSQGIVQIDETPDSCIVSPAVESCEHKWSSELILLPYPLEKQEASVPLCILEHASTCLLDRWSPPSLPAVDSEKHPSGSPSWTAFTLCSLRPIWLIAAL